MSVACTVASNPFYQISQKSNNATIVPKTTSKLIQNQNQKQGHLLSINTNNATSINPFMNHSNISANVPPSNTAAIKNNDNWLFQFQQMSVIDPVECSDNYKSLYAQYEGKSLNNTTTTRENFNAGNNIMMMQKYQNYANTIAPTTKTAYDSVNEDFSVVDAELESMMALQPDQSVIGEVDQDQLLFKNAAVSIVNITNTDSNISNTNSQFSTDTTAKFKRSKFLGLMRRISDEDVTLKRHNCEQSSNNTNNAKYDSLYSSELNECVGDEYITIPDKLN
ncbi:uncharacterized protein SCODWIG_02054 [Saccharomycodes ludwigii]|uniref:PEX18/PEX21 C-terminal domain-containing protein n=1 Tax=Saccharomycodes ludwigii TaxID=36035 RepID=A0A376B6I4_9ASCO|nr:hypothetical protein SCDLUD_004546 [Saccharomycodes ludwigii]KAH3899120.1 hypothetical protein SCDLUD_004546 [Saccharomycodes ludwigii]SSD60293.1 uncharacterized protein SCODWIG_02054 [Saccharomycodes ludwigii]